MDERAAQECDTPSPRWNLLLAIAIVRARLGSVVILEQVAPMELRAMLSVGDVNVHARVDPDAAIVHGMSPRLAAASMISQVCNFSSRFTRHAANDTASFIASFCERPLALTRPATWATNP